MVKMGVYTYNPFEHKKETDKSLMKTFFHANGSDRKPNYSMTVNIIKGMSV